MAGVQEIQGRSLGACSRTFQEQAYGEDGPGPARDFFSQTFFLCKQQYRGHVSLIDLELQICSV